MITNTERTLSIENRNERPYIIDDNLEKCMSCSHTLNYISKETRVCHFCGMPIDFQDDSYNDNFIVKVLRPGDKITRTKSPILIEDDEIQPKTEIPKDLETCSLCGSKMFFNSGCASCPSCGNSLCLNG